MKKNLFILLIAVVSAVSLSAGSEKYKIREIYAPGGKFSELAHAYEGEKITLTGFMAPPLKPDAKFFVLTKMPMAVCPFCDNEADWPLDIVVVIMKKELEAVRFNQPIVATGILELGTDIDEETGFLSRVRLTEASFKEE